MKTSPEVDCSKSRHVTFVVSSGLVSLILCVRSLQSLVGPGGVIKTSGQHFPGGKERESGPLVRQGCYTLPQTAN